MLRRRTVPVVQATAVALVLSSAVFSVPAIAEESLAIEEIIVTARKREETSQDVPIAITAISAELTSSTVRDLTDLNGFAPNVRIDENGSRSSGASITIRGISPTRSGDNSFDSPIGVMIDGVFLGSLAGQILENFDLERIEIMRGPQGTLFGKNTVGGVIHVIRSRPTGEFGLRLKATVGEDGQREIRAVANTSLIEDKLAAKLFMTSIQDDGYMDNITTGTKIPQKDYSNYGLTFLATPTDNFEALFTIEQFKDNSELSAFQTNYNVGPGIIDPPTDPNESDYSGGFLACVLYPEVCRTSLDTPKVAEHDTLNEARLRVNAYTLNMRYDLNENMTLVSVTGYRDMNEYRIFDFDGASAPYITIERFNDYEQFSQELRIDGTWENLTVTAGGYYWESEFTQDWVTGGQFWSSLFGGVVASEALYAACLGTNGLDGAFAPIACDAGLTSIPLGDDVTQILYETQKTESIAFFAQADYTFAEDWTVTAGLRWTQEKKHFIAGQSYLSNVARQRERAFPGYADLSNKWDEISPKVGLTYQLTDDAIIYASYSEGFHSGGFFGVNQNIRDFERDQYDPEFANSYEVGLKSTWLDNRLRLNLTGFYNDFKDKQESFVAIDEDTKTVASKFDNAARVTYKGLELEAQYVVNANLRVFFNYGYLDAEYDEFETDINATDGLDLVEDASHLTPRGAPKNTIGLGGTFTVPLGGGELEIFSKWSWIDELELSLLNTPLGRLDSRSDVTASIGFHAEQYSVVAFGRNLTNVRTEGFSPIATLFAVGSVNKPRSFGVEFSYEF